MHMGRRLWDYRYFYLRFLAILHSREVLATLLLERLLSKLVLEICISIGLNFWWQWRPYSIIKWAEVFWSLHVVKLVLTGLNFWWQWTYYSILFTNPNKGSLAILLLERRL